VLFTWFMYVDCQDNRNTALWIGTQRLNRFTGAPMWHTAALKSTEVLHLQCSDPMCLGATILLASLSLGKSAILPDLPQLHSDHHRQTASTACTARLYGGK
jgi:hypothetical protein